MKNNSIIKLIFYIIIPLFGGLIIGKFSNTNNYNLFVPSFVFQIVWTILYTLMGISSYLVKNNGGNLLIYYIQLTTNFLWPIIYFNLNAKFLALIVLIILIILVINMLNYFKEYSILASLLQLPYLFWLSFALFLNIISLLN